LQPPKEIKYIDDFDSEDDAENQNEDFEI